MNYKRIKQRGAATLLTSVIIFIAITIVAMLSGKTILNETKIAADNYRISQAVAAASYAMDYSVNYFNSGGFDQVINADGTSGSDGIADVLGALTLTSADSFLTTAATVEFEHDAAGCGGGTSWKSGMITATGFSDDGLATRQITQCVGPLGLLKDEGPDQPLVSRGQVFLTGTSNIVNRYTNTTVWSGNEFTIGSSASIQTFIKDSAVGVLDPVNDLNQLINVDENTDTQLVSNKNLGNGLDIIDNDPSLGGLTGDAFFGNFFQGSKEIIKGRADDIGQVFDNPSDAADKSGIIWIGDTSSTDVSTTAASYTLGGGTIGSITAPAVLIINGDLSINGNPIIYGLVYVIGKYSITGNPDIIGSNIVEGTDITSGSSASAPVFTGNGTLDLIYWPAFGDGDGNPILGQTAVISGSWRDW